jgi:hypothetical protein
MDLSQLTQLSVIGGVATALATNILKSPYLPVPAQNHPRFTALVIALGASTYTAWQAGFRVDNAHDWTQWVALSCGILIVSVNVYNHLLKKS